jgi:hypothetical protein
MARFEVLKHNTLVDHGFLQEERRPVPNEELEDRMMARSTHAEWEDKSTTPAQKRRVAEVKGQGVGTATFKRRKLDMPRSTKVDRQSKFTLASKATAKTASISKLHKHASLFPGDSD